MIFIANNTREIEKNNLNLKIKISKISENLKINKIELAAHQNTSYLKTLYELYFYDGNPILTHMYGSGVFYWKTNRGADSDFWNKLIESVEQNLS